MTYTPPGVKIIPVTPKGTATLFIPEFSPKMVVIGKVVPYKARKFEPFVYNGPGYYDLEYSANGIKEILKVVDSLGQVYTSFPKWLSWYWTSDEEQTLTSFAHVVDSHDEEAGGVWSIPSANADLVFSYDDTGYYVEVSNIAAGATVVLRLSFDQIQNWIPYHINKEKTEATGPGAISFGFDPLSMLNWSAVVKISDGANVAESGTLTTQAGLQNVEFKNMTNISFDLLGGVSYLQLEVTNNDSEVRSFRVYVIKLKRNDSNINKMIWFNSASEVPAEGSEIYVTYYHMRSSDDYNEVKTFPKSVVEAGDPWEEAREELGDPTRDNELSIALHYLFNVLGLRRVSVVMTTSNSPDEMLRGWDVAYETDFDYVVLLGDISTIEGTLRSKIVDAFRPESKKERFVFVGLPKLPDSMSVDDKLTKAMQTADRLKNQYTLFTVPDKAVYSFEFTPMFENASTTVTYILPGYFWALGVAGVKASFEDPSMPLIRVEVRGLRLYTADGFWFRDSVMNQLAGVGITVIKPADLGSDIPIIREDLTTDMTDEYTSSFAANDITMFVTKKVRSFLDKNFIGKKMNDRAAMLSSIQAALRSYLEKTFVNRQIITEILSMTVSIAPDDPRKILIKWVLKYPAPVRNIEGTFTYTM